MGTGSFWLFTSGRREEYGVLEQEYQELWKIARGQKGNKKIPICVGGVPATREQLYERLATVSEACLAIVQTCEGEEYRQTMWQARSRLHRRGGL